jgi:hypothetical protein
VEIISPLKGQTVHGEVHFQWDSTSRPPFTLVTMSNGGVVREEVTLTEPQYTLKERLENGLYYWKLVAEGELLYVGKFLVRRPKAGPGVGWRSSPSEGCEFRW